MQLEPRSVHERIRARWEALRTEREPWKNLWQQIAEYTTPDSGIFTPAETNRPRSRNKILNSVAINCIHTLGAGLLAGVCSPTKPWFNISVAGIDIASSPRAREWTTAVQRIVLDEFAKANVYVTLQSKFEGSATDGTAASLLTPDPDGDGISLQPLAIGTFAIATDDFGRVNTLYREFRMTVAQLVARFGFDNCSQNVQNLYKHSKFDEWINCVHAIEPRFERDISKMDSRNMAYGSYYFEENAAKDEFLEEGGYPYFPAIVSRWSVRPGDVYGTGPGIDSLPDIKQIQVMEKRKLQALDLSLNPPLQGPTTFRARTVNNFPGGYTPIDNANNPIRPLVDVRLDYSGIIAVENEVIDRVRKNFFNDLFLMLANDPDGNRTATEINERRQEKMMVIGPVLLRLEPEVLRPLVINTYNILLQQGKIPDPPQEISQMPLEIEFISLLNQAQKSSELTQMDRIVSVVQALGQIDPQVLQAIKPVELLTRYAALMDVPPEVLRSNEELEQIRQAQIQAQQAQAQAQIQAQQAQAVGSLLGAASQAADATGLTIDRMSGF